MSLHPPECFSTRVLLHRNASPSKSFSTKASPLKCFPQECFSTKVSPPWFLSTGWVHAEQPAAPDLWGARAKDWVQPFVVGADCREISAVSHALARSLAHLQPTALMTSIIKRDRSPKSVCTAQCTPDSCHCSLKERLSSSNFYTDSKSLQS